MNQGNKMTLGKQLFFTLILIFGSALAHASIAVRVTTSFYNENWFPLSAKDMREAAIDTALDDISRKGLLSFVKKKSAGNLDLKVTLIEPAQIVKLTITLNVDEVSSAVATASTSIEDLDFNGIYYAFEHVGREAASRMNAKLTVIEGQRKHKRDLVKPTKQALPDKLTKTPTSQRSIIATKPTKPTKPAVCQKESITKFSQKMGKVWPLKRTYRYGQKMKEQRCYFAATVAFQTVASADSEGDEAWKKLASEELIFGLPVFEAKQLSLDLSSLLQDQSKGINDINGHLNRIEQLYRQVLVENEQSVAHIIEVQRLLDETHLTRRALMAVFESSTMASASPIRMTMEMKYNMGTWPKDRDQFEKDFKPYLDDFEVIHLEADSRKMTVRLRHLRWLTKLELSFDNGRSAMRVLN